MKATSRTEKKKRGREEGKRARAAAERANRQEKRCKFGEEGSEGEGRVIEAETAAVDAVRRGQRTRKTRRIIKEVEPQKWDDGEYRQLLAYSELSVLSLTFSWAIFSLSLNCLRRSPSSQDDDAEGA